MSRSFQSAISRSYDEPEGDEGLWRAWLTVSSIFLAGLILISWLGALPGAPIVLKPLPLDERITLQQEENKLLTTYGWIDQQKGVVRIPITRAIQLTAERGLPVREQPPVPEATVKLPLNSN